MEPLASRIRPKDLDEFFGQQHLVGPGKPLRAAMENKHIFSFIFWGPPGVGKTTLAKIYAKKVGADFVEMSAVSAGKEDIKKLVERTGAFGQPTVLFLDEIHRFNKAQQDYLLPFVERGTLTLIGATTENPSFEIIPALLSRCRVFVLTELNKEELAKIIECAKVEVDAESKDWLVSMANGDARQALTMIENTLKLYQTITVENLKRTLQSKYLRFDKQGEEHYNTISAYIKSLRASNTDAALYYLARLVESGEDPKFIARRMVIFASEDIGIANPQALTIANNVFRAVEIIGYPECAINLAHGTVYLAQADKNRSAYSAYIKAVDDVKQTGNLPIPLELRNAPTKLMKDLGCGNDYEAYTKKDLLPDGLKGNKYYYN